MPEQRNESSAAQDKHRPWAAVWLETGSAISTTGRGGSEEARGMTDTGQLELVPTPRCDYCGHLGWTEARFGRLAHKCSCPHRNDPWCQAHPKGCGHFTDIRARKFGDWDPATAEIPY